MEKVELVRFASDAPLDASVGDDTPQHADALISRRKGFRQVLAEELQQIDESHAARQRSPLQRKPDSSPGVMDDPSAGSDDQRFSLAFSGGGIRAAAFQSGVLWSLAEQGLLKNIDYWVAVSGGGYITAAFMSHLLASKPEPGEDTDSFYLRVVASTLTRMQKNAGNFIRDPAEVGGAFSDSDWPPRFLDGVLLILSLFTAVILNPLLLVAIFVVPYGEIIHLFYAAPLRSAWCNGVMAWEDEVRGPFASIGELWNFSRFALMLAFVTFVLHKTCARWQQDTGEMRYLVVRSLMSFSSRMFIFALATCVIVLVLPLAQLVSFPPPNGQMQNGNELCVPYARRYLDIETFPAMPCVDWSRLQRELTWVEELNQEINETSLAYPPRPRALNDVYVQFFGLFFTIFALFVTVVPIAPHLATEMLIRLGPALLIAILVSFAQWRIYGPVTGQAFAFGRLHFDEETWHTFLLYFAPTWVLCLVLYPQIRSTWHYFYKRSLQHNFFHLGEDSAYADLTSQPYCPFMLLTGTVNDFRPPGATETTDEIHFSPLHMGGQYTGFVRMPKHMSLAKCTALTGAGCLDALTLSMSSDIRYRFWLALLHLSWGSDVLFLPREMKFLPFIRRWFGEGMATKMKESTFVDWVMHRLPTISLWMLIFLCGILGYMSARRRDISRCGDAAWFMGIGVAILCLLVASSFFGFLRQFRFMMFSPLLRQFHQLSNYIYESRLPPGTLYVTDGGIKDCTGVRQLLRRRRKRILLALAGADSQDRLGVVRIMMEVCMEDKLAYFFDPNDSRQYWKTMLDNFMDDKEIMWLHIGILYPADPEAGEPETTGKLVICKNRLPPSWTQDDRGLRFEMQPLMTKEEICETPSASSAESRPVLRLDMDDPLFKLHPEELGGLGCCDCCHRRGCNWGPKFPHLSGLNYLTLTPQLFNCLCRLGRRVSVPGIAELMRSEA